MAAQDIKSSHGETDMNAWYRAATSDDPDCVSPEDMKKIFNQVLASEDCSQSWYYEAMASTVASIEGESRMLSNALNPSNAVRKTTRLASLTRTL